MTRLVIFRGVLGFFLRRQNHLWFVIYSIEIVTYDLSVRCVRLKMVQWVVEKLNFAITMELAYADPPLRIC